MLVAIRAGSLLSPSQLRATFEMPMYRFGRFSPPIVGLVHGRPLEVCPSIDEAYARHTGLEQQRRRGRTVARLVAFAREYHATSRSIMLGTCSGGWVWQPGPTTGHLYAQFARDAPVAWIFKRLGGSEVLIGLFALTSALLGAYALGRLVRSLTNSNGVVALALGIFAWSVSELFRIFGLQLLWAFYGVLTCWLIVCWNRESTARPRLAAVVLVPALIVHLAGYMVVAYSAAMGPIALSIVAMALSVAARPSRSRMLQLGAVAAGVWLVVWDCAAFSKRQLAPISTLNFAGSGSFGDLALSTGFWTERPSPVPFPLGDGGVYAAYLAEPLIRAHATFIYEYQGFAAFGRTLFRATVWRHPLTAIESACKRLFILLVRLPVLAQTIAATNPWFIAMSQVAASGALVLALVVAFFPARWHLELPILLIPLWNVFGIELLTHLVHTHSTYYVFGLMQLAMLAPALVLIAVRVGRAGLPLRPPVFLRRKLATVAFTVAAVLLAVWSYSSARRELLTFDIWYQPWVGVYRLPADQQALEPAAVADKIERLRALGERTPGSISMYGVWMMSRLSSNVWVPESGIGEKLQMTKEELDTRRQRARDLAVAYFRRAATEAPHDPWIQTFTETWDPDNVTHSFPGLLERDLQHPFAPWWAYVLAMRTTGATQARYADVFEDLTHKQLVRTAALRPGFAAKPRLDAAAAADDGAEWTEVRLHDAGVMLLGSTPAFRSDRLGLLVYIHSISGSAHASLVAETDQGIAESPEQRISDSDVHRYRVFRWSGASPAHRMKLRLRAEPGRTVLVRVRDFYPLIENPHVASVD